MERGRFHLAGVLGGHDRIPAARRLHRPVGREGKAILIPGYGAQGGKAEDIAQYLSKGNGGVVNSSRGILLAYKKQPGAAFDEAAYNECVNMKEAIAHACSLL